MGMGSLTLACVLLLANAGAESEFMNRPGMKIPIAIPPEQRGSLREILLFSSSDEGKTWSQVARATPDQSFFVFTAPGDGKYWLSIQTVDKNGVKAPSDIAAASVGQRIIVDTVKPQVKVKADRKGDEIVVSWEVNEDHPDASTFAVEYHLAEQPSAIWTAVANAVPGATGAVTFRPLSNSPVLVQLRVKDKAKNEGIGIAEVAAATLIAGQTPGTGTFNAWSADSQPPTPAPPVPVAPLPVTPETRPLPPPLPTPSLPVQQQFSTPPPFSSGPMTALRGALPAKQLVNKPDVKLDFDVTNLGPSGFGTVDVWMTTDEGTVWSPVRVDVGAIQSPEMRGPGQVRGNVMVHVPEDGKVFGYYLVVKSKANLGKPDPRSGDLPQIRLERDMVSPTALLNMPQPDPGRRDTLILTWEAKDRNLTDKPISLQWSPHPDGPWEFIGPSELPNTGRYAWQVPPTAPPSVFLKLTVCDGAGNVSVAQSPKPVLVDLSVPEVAAVNISPTP